MAYFSKFLRFQPGSPEPLQNAWFYQDSFNFNRFCYFRHPGQVPQKPSRMMYAMGFRAILLHLVLNWPGYLFSASWLGHPEPLQNGVFYWVSCYFGPFTAKLALVAIFSISARSPRTFPKLCFLLGFVSFWSICCWTGPGSYFQHLGQVPQNPSKIVFSIRFGVILVHLLLNWLW